MKKCNNKIKANKYAFGAKEITDGLSAVGNIAQGFNSGNQTAQSVFSGLDSIGNFASSINPIAGMAVKGVVGVGKAITSIVGTKGSVDQATGEITEGTGILGRKNRSKLRQQSGIVKNNIAAAQNSARYAADWYSENGYNEPTMVANGGIIPNTLAYLDDGELIRTPDGNIMEIPEEGKPQDSNLMNVPVGTQVLSDKIKVPGTNKTFAQKGKEIMKKRKYSGNDKYAENSKKLNDKNSQIAYNQLLDLQESLKSKSKNKTKKYALGTNGVESDPYKIEYADADVMIDDNVDNNLYIPRPTIGKLPKFDTPLTVDTALINEIYRNPTKFFNSLKTNDLEDSRPQYYAEPNLGMFSNSPAIKSGLVRPGWSHGSQYNPNINVISTDKPTQYFVGVTPKKQKAKSTSAQTNSSNTKKETQLVAPPKAEYIRPEFDFSKSIGNEDIWKISDEQKRNWSKSYSPSTTSGQPTTSSEKKSSFDYTDLLGSLAGLVAPIQNITAKRGETNVPYTYTPKYGPTNWNISPILNEINGTNSISRYNMSNINPNTGANMAYGIQSAIARDNAIAQAYSEKLNKESIMAAQNADIYNRWAQFDTTARHTAAVENAQDRAALDNVRRTGWRDLSTALQTMSKDRRLSKKDKALLEAMKPYLDYGMTSEQLNNLYNLLG